jgi:methyl-CpG-binding domain protein 4
VRRWGDGVAASLPASADWRAFVTSRLTTPPPPSRLELMQEFYAHDTWQLLACCILMSRVSSHAVKTNTVAAFFARCPTPTALLQAPGEELQRIMHPLGLFPGRMQSLVALSRAYLEQPVFEAGLTPETKIYGIGEFGVASFQIFCRGNLGITPADATLKAFVAWQRRHAARAAGGAGAEADASSEEEEDE